MSSIVLIKEKCIENRFFNPKGLYFDTKFVSEFQTDALEIDRIQFKKKVFCSNKFIEISDPI